MTFTTLADPTDDALRLPAPASLEEAGLSADLVNQLLLKTLHFAGELTAVDCARRVGLAFPAIEPVLDLLKHQRQCEVVGGLAVGGASYRYRITDAGRARAALLLAQNQYIGT